MFKATYLSIQVPVDENSSALAQTGDFNLYAVVELTLIVLAACASLIYRKKLND